MHVVSLDGEIYSVSELSPYGFIQLWRNDKGERGVIFDYRDQLPSNVYLLPITDINLDPCDDVENGVTMVTLEELVFAIHARYPKEIPYGLYKDLETASAFSTFRATADFPNVMAQFLQMLDRTPKNWLEKDPSANTEVRIYRGTLEVKADLQVPNPWARHTGLWFVKYVDNVPRCAVNFQPYDEVRVFPVRYAESVRLMDDTVRITFDELVEWLKQNPILDRDTARNFIKDIRRGGHISRTFVSMYSKFRQDPYWQVLFQFCDAIEDHLPENEMNEASDEPIVEIPEVDLPDIEEAAEVFAVRHTKTGFYGAVFEKPGIESMALYFSTVPGVPGISLLPYIAEENSRIEASDMMTNCRVAMTTRQHRVWRETLDNYQTILRELFAISDAAVFQHFYMLATGVSARDELMDLLTKGPVPFSISNYARTVKLLTDEVLFREEVSREGFLPVLAGKLGLRWISDKEEESEYAVYKAIVKLLDKK